MGNKENIFVVRCRRILGDDLQFRKLQKKVYLDGQQIFNGLPDWAMKMQKEDSFDKLMMKLMRRSMRALNGLKRLLHSKNNIKDYHRASLLLLLLLFVCLSW